jgi:alkylresorcinol/alkylpyrone synthase
MTAEIRSLATANPPTYVSQKEAYRFFKSHLDLEPEEDDLYRRVLLDGPIRGRHIGVDRYEESCERDPAVLLDRYLKFGRLTAADAARRALRDAGLEPGDIDAIVVNSCTGYLCPGLSSYLVEDLCLPETVRPLDIMGMGCGAAIPNLECAAGLIAGGRHRHALCVSVEVCSATAYMGADPALIISNCIFGDGAAAAVLGPHSSGQGVAALVDIESHLAVAHREDLRYRTEPDGRLRNVLSRRVPVLGARVAGEACGRLLARHDLAIGDISHWAIHAGGTAVLTEVGRKLGLSEHDLEPSLHVFSQFGNMSSPTVLFALRRILDTREPEPGSYAVLLAFGAGFSGFAALLRFHGNGKK